ncbi:hypothetical protein [Caminibacter sp.]
MRKLAFLLILFTSLFAKSPLYFSDNNFYIPKRMNVEDKYIFLQKINTDMNSLYKVYKFIKMHKRKFYLIEMGYNNYAYINNIVYYCFGDDVFDNVYYNGKIKNFSDLIHALLKDTMLNMSPEKISALNKYVKENYYLPFRLVDTIKKINLNTKKIKGQNYQNLVEFYREYRQVIVDFHNNLLKLKKLQSFQNLLQNKEMKNVYEQLLSLTDKASKNLENILKENLEPYDYMKFF